MKRVIVTGPVERIEEYARAAASAGWDAIELALLAIEPCPVDRRQIQGDRFDWICVTSSSALPYLAAALESLPALRSTPCAVVGARTGERLRELGLRVDFGPAEDAAALAEGLRARAGSGRRLLWPRGSLSDDLARRMRAAGFEVCDPVAYTARPADSAGSIAPPASEAVFFASPSAVRAWHALEAAGETRIAIAIGATTFDALMQETAPRFFDTISLPQPTPEALGFVLAHLEPETSP